MWIGFGEDDFEEEEGIKVYKGEELKGCLDWGYLFVGII